MKKIEQNLFNDEVIEKYNVKASNYNNRVKSNTIPQQQMQNQNTNKNEQNNMKVQLKKHREELELLELKIKNEQKSGKEDRKAASSLKRQPLISNNASNLPLSNQMININKISNNVSPIKGVVKSDSMQLLNQSKPLGMRLSQAGSDIIVPQKNKLQLMIDDAYMKNLQNNSISQSPKHPMYSGSLSPPAYRPSVNSHHQYTNQQSGNLYDSIDASPKMYNSKQRFSGSNIMEGQQQMSKKIIMNNPYPDQYKRGLFKNSGLTLTNESYENQYYNLQGKPQQPKSLTNNITLPHYLKDLSIIKLPNEDEVHFDELNLFNEAHLVDKYSEFLNNDNDLFYLERSVQSYFESEQKDSNAFKGALAVCFDTQNHQADYKYIHQNYKVSLKKIASNPMIYAGLASQSANQNLEATNQGKMISYSKLTTPQSEKNSNFGKSENFTNILTQEGQQDHLVNKDDNKVVQVKSKQISRVHTNSTNTNQSFFNKLFSQMPQTTGQQLMSEFQSVQNEYKTHQVFTYKVFILTKFKVRIDIGFVQVSFNMNVPNTLKTYTQCIIHRLYISRMYRKLNYAHFIYLQVYNFLFATYPNLEKVTISLSNNAQQYLKFKQSIGFKLENVKTVGDQNNHSQQIRLVLKRFDFGQILTHIQQKKFIEKPGLDNNLFTIQNKIPLNNLIPSF